MLLLSIVGFPVAFVLLPDPLGASAVSPQRRARHQPLRSRWTGRGRRGRSRLSRQPEQYRRQERSGAAGPHHHSVGAIDAGEDHRLYPVRRQLRAKMTVIG
jgi:hypothetical protein